MDGVKYRIGHVSPFGATLLGDGAVSFSVLSSDATACELLLYRQGERDPFAVVPFSDDFRIGNVFSMIVYGFDFEEMEYAYRMDGPCDPRNGYLFDPAGMCWRVVAYTAGDVGDVQGAGDKQITLASRSSVVVLGA